MEYLSNWAVWALNAPSLQTDKMQIQRQRMKEIVSWRDVYCFRDWILINVMLSTHATLYPQHRWQENRQDKTTHRIITPVYDCILYWVLLVPDNHNYLGPQIANTFKKRKVQRFSVPVIFKDQTAASLDTDQYISNNDFVQIGLISTWLNYAFSSGPLQKQWHLSVSIHYKMYFKTITEKKESQSHNQFFPPDRSPYTCIKSSALWSLEIYWVYSAPACRIIYIHSDIQQRMCVKTAYSLRFF